MQPTSNESSAPTQPDDDRPFEPNWASPPSDTIRDCLREKGISVEGFASAMGVGIMTIAALLTGDIVISPEIATRLSLILGGSKEFWIAREAMYRMDKARLANDV